MRQAATHKKYDRNRNFGAKQFGDRVQLPADVISVPLHHSEGNLCPVKKPKRSVRARQSIPWCEQAAIPELAFVALICWSDPCCHAAAGFLTCHSRPEETSRPGWHAAACLPPRQPYVRPSARRDLIALAARRVQRAEESSEPGDNNCPPLRGKLPGALRLRCGKGRPTKHCN